LTSHRGRVLVVVHEATLTGATLAVLRIVPLLEERGWKFSFWVPKPGTAAAELTAMGYEHAGEARPIAYSLGSLRAEPGVGRRIQRTPGYLRRLREWAKEGSPAILHVNTLNAIPEMVAARGIASATLLHVHEMLPAGIKGATAARLIRVAADGVVTNSAASVAALARARVAARLVRNGVPLGIPPQPHSDRGDRLVVGTLGTVCRGKGSDLFLAAAQQVRRTLPETEFRMIGPIADGREQDWGIALMEAARRLGVQCGTTAEVFAELADWDILVMPSRQEAFGLAVAEAMAASLPVVASAVGGIPEIVAENSGVLVPREDVNALADAILTLARQPRLRTAMGAAGRKRVAQEFSLDKQAEGMHRLYLDLLE
jgi:glycosyltransferase involved in cell wall biosynthesis